MRSTWKNGHTLESIAIVVVASPFLKVCSLSWTVSGHVFDFLIKMRLGDFCAVSST